MTLFQSSSTGCATFVDRLAGDTNVGAAGAVVDGFTVNEAERVMPPETAVIVDVVAVVTEPVVIVKFALVAPDGTVTFAGTVVAVELSDSDTTAPPAGAAAVRVTVPVEDVPPVTLAGFTDNADSVGVEPPSAGLIVSVPALVTFSNVAEICTVDVEVTCATFTGNVVLVWPCETITLKGTVASTVLLLSRFTTELPGDADASVTLPVTVPGPTTVLGVNVTDVGASETDRNKFAATVTPAAAARISTNVNSVTGEVLAMKLALV